MTVIPSTAKRLMKLPLITRLRQSQTTRTSRYTVSGSLKQRQPPPISLARHQSPDAQHRALALSTSIPETTDQDRETENLAQQHRSQDHLRSQDQLPSGPLAKGEDQNRNVGHVRCGATASLPELSSTSPRHIAGTSNQKR